MPRRGGRAGLKSVMCSWDCVREYARRNSKKRYLTGIRSKECKECSGSIRYSIRDVVGKNKKYCSQMCAGEAKSKAARHKRGLPTNTRLEKRTCKQCNVEYYRHYQYPKTKFCSLKCAVANRDTRTSTQCKRLGCHNKVIASRYERQTGRGVYCSVSCQSAGRRSSVRIACSRDGCRKFFEEYRSRLQTRLNFCSNRCKDRHLRTRSIRAKACIACGRF